MYPKTGETTTTAVELEVNAKRRTAASIGKFGEEDLFRFTAASDGRYQIDTRGPTDIVMKLFGPNSETALIAEDDDSGVDTNALISRDLVAGQYFGSGTPLQSRQWQGQLFYQGAAPLSHYSISAAESRAISRRVSEMVPRLGTRPPIRNRASCRNTLHAPRSVGKVGPRVILVSEVAPRGYHGC